MARTDLSENLIHFTKGATREDAFKNLLAIIQDGTIFANNGMIKGELNCVCFTEAPIEALDEKYYERYSPFGILLPKEYIYEQGGRPVIYQADEEYSILPDKIKWRHVRYEYSPKRYDWTWEREWRINKNVDISEKTAIIVVLDNSWAQRLLAEHEEIQEQNAYSYSQVLDDLEIQMLYESFDWHIITIK